MKLQEMLEIRGIDLTKTRLIRHNISNEDVAKNLERGNLEIYQSIQLPNRFKNCDYVISFLGVEGTEGKLMGCYKVEKHTPLVRNLLPVDYSEKDKKPDKCVFFHMKKTNILADLENRLIIDWGKGVLTWCQNGTNEKEILYILPAVSEFEFISYDKVLLSYEALKHIVNHSKEHKEWENKLSSVAGIYLITDIKTGKHYVGSASGAENGIWGRWSEYAKTKHGGNKRIVELMKEDENYCYNFQYSILEVFPIKRDKHEILECEQLYKRKLYTRQFGLNDN